MWLKKLFIGVATCVMKHSRAEFSEAEGTWYSYLWPQISFSSLPPHGLVVSGGVRAMSPALPGLCSQGEGGIGQGCARGCFPGPALCVFTGLASEVKVFAEG